MKLVSQFLLCISVLSALSFAQDRDPNILAVSAVCRAGGKTWGRSFEAPVPVLSGGR